MTKINNCTLVLIDCYNYGGAASSLKKSMEQCEFDHVLFLTDLEIELPGIEIIKIPTIKSTQEYSHFILTELYKYITTDYVLITQHDGWVLDGSQFDERLYDYDYAGAIWPERDGLTNGNGGFSWRSKKLLESIANDRLIRKVGVVQEDVTICRVYREYLQETYGLKWATEEMCNKFSFELIEANQPTFGFHGYFHHPYKPTIILKRSAAIGDIIMLEPIMRWYHMNNYNVVLDIPIQFFDLFSSHYFPVKHISNFNRNISAKEINLDGSYESKPNQLYQKTYAEFCGIKDFKPSRPVLHPLVDGKTKLFRRYAVIHIDERETAHRNIYGVDWQKVREYLESKGYFVIQVGLFKHETVAIEINTQSIGLLKFIISGCDLFLGTDSACSHIATAYNKPSLIFFGSVNKDFIHTDFTNIETIENTCQFSGCWHTKAGSVRGVDCVFDKVKPPCCVHDSETIISKLEKLINV